MNINKKIKVKIDPAGNLWLARGPLQRLKPQGCAFDGSANCGDGCSLFGEPAGGPKKLQINLCQQKTIYFEIGEFVDERE